jgi:membrane fusion protein (multidrug efflux system)
LAYWILFLKSTVSTDDAIIDGFRMTISPEEPGRIISLKVDEGANFDCGDLLVQLDSSVLKAQEAQALAEVDLDSNAAIRAAIIMDLSRIDFERASYQFKTKVISQQQYDHVRNTFKSSQAAYNMAEAQTASARAVLRIIRTRLGKMQVYAPSRGFIAKRWVVQGDVVQPGQAIFTAFEDSIWVTMYLQETGIAELRLGDHVDISVDTYHGSRFAGQVILIGPAAAALFSLLPPNNASGNFTKVTQRIACRSSIHPVDVVDTALRFRPGTSVEVQVRTGRRR